MEEIFLAGDPIIFGGSFEPWRDCIHLPAASVGDRIRFSSEIVTSILKKKTKMTFPLVNLILRLTEAVGRLWCSLCGTQNTQLPSHTEGTDWPTQWVQGDPWILESAGSKCTAHVG